MKFTFDKSIRDAAKEQGRGLFGMIADTKTHKMVSGGPVDHDLASKLFLFCTKVLRGAKPSDAVAEVWK